MQNICYNCFHYAPEGQICPFCKYDPRENEGRYRLALRPGTPLANRYLVGRVLGQGGFGITYVALDNQTKSRVAIKEYMPTEYASRDEGTVGLRLYDNSVQADFDYGKEQFLQEAKTLAEFVGNEHIIGVRGMFEANGTAYFAMEFAEGVSLKQYMEQRGGALQVHEANRILLPIMEALQWVHSKGIVHRDIAPDNIIIKRDGTAKLIDFGAARYSTGEKSKSLDVILKHGFAPYEQYSRRGRQGPFTDVYAMAATYYYAITGKVPPDAVDRMDGDTLQSPGAYGVRIRKETEEVLLKALAVSSKNRYQTIAEFYTALLNSIPAPFDPDVEIGDTAVQLSVQPVKNSPPLTVVPPPKKEEPKPARQPQKKPEPVAEKPKKKTPMIAIAAVLAVFILAGVVFGTNMLKESLAVSEPTPSTAPTATVEAKPEVQKLDETEKILTNPERQLESCYGYQSLKLLSNNSILTTYTELYEHVGRFDGSFSSEELVFQKPLTKEQFTTAWYAFRGDTPQYFWYSPSFPTLIKSTDETDKYQSCIIRYSYVSKKDLDEAKMQFDTAVNNIMGNSGINMDMSELLKELILYKKVGDYIHVEDVEDMEQLTYRAIVEKRGNCLGVSNAFAYILQENGIMAYVVNGETNDNANHAWVLVRIDGNYTWCDLTWDAYGAEVGTKYLNQSKQDFQKDHAFIDGYILPDNSTTLLDLFKERNGVISKKDVNEAIKKFSDTGEKIDNTWYLPIYADGDFSSAYDFWLWWDANEQEYCWRILHGISPSITLAWQIATLDHVWIIAATEGNE